MFKVAIVNNGVVVGVTFFQFEEDIDGWDYSFAFGEEAYGVRIANDAPVNVGDLYENGNFSPAPPPPKSYEEMVIEATNDKYFKLKDGKEEFLHWLTQVCDGILSGEIKASFDSWRVYIDQLELIDTNQAPDINWPVKPEAPTL